MLSLAAAHLTYLVPDEPRYQHAKDYLFGRALRDYREALSAPITADNCDPLLGGAVLVHWYVKYMTQLTPISFIRGHGGSSGSSPGSHGGTKPAPQQTEPSANMCF